MGEFKRPTDHSGQLAILPEALYTRIDAVGDEDFFIVAFGGGCQRQRNREMQLMVEVSSAGDDLLHLVIVAAKDDQTVVTGVSHYHITCKEKTRKLSYPSVVLHVLP
jgi:hypothetical protein